ncbi:MAG TPA: hypothetical protein VNT42_05065 [Sphingomonas sp.]|nr:hypothetical protein [Sphingomonas sp.]
MAREHQSAAGGFFMAIAIFAGAIVGAACGQPSIGVVVGTATGVVFAILLWLRDRRRVGH